MSDRPAREGVDPPHRRGPGASLGSWHSWDSPIGLGVALVCLGGFSTLILWGVSLLT